MRWMWINGLCLCSLLTSGAVAGESQQSVSRGSIYVQVRDGQGAFTREASVYVLGERALNVRNVHSGDVLPLPPGHYGLIAAWVQPSEEGFSRQMSPLAEIDVVAGDHVSVVLPLADVRLFDPEPLALNAFIRHQGS